MRRMILSLCILCSVFSLTACNSYYLHSMTTEMNTLLAESCSFTQTEQWAKAEAAFSQARNRWDRHQIYFGITLYEKDIEAVELGFCQAEAYLYWQEQGDFASASTQLISEIQQLYEAESLNVKTLL